ncbi:uncharacterized protein E0L32_009348 [Thyridium curvatum]|uniref:Uncharacterized protein n=1 Tax=Thyridium curvatum TaxID=1093900 RepID=A0A507AYZ1_9PEZI|nr:uncharacterized protein E0L32_009348 [Thyridium curvatum]TPX09460.1 hypothetical protein E0L32_009348 [Thyridium curvatum]
MKFTLVALLTAATVAMANPHQGANFPQLVERKACYHESDCGWTYGAKCEHYCRQYGQDVGVDRMEKCSILNNKRCCCTK